MRQLGAYTKCVGDCPYAIGLEDEGDTPQSLIVLGVPFTMIDNDPADPGMYLVEILNYKGRVYTVMNYNSDEKTPQLQHHTGIYLLIFEKKRLQFSSECDSTCRYSEEFGYTLSAKKLRMPMRISPEEAVKYAHLFSLFVTCTCECAKNT